MRRSTLARQVRRHRSPRSQAAQGAGVRECKAEEAAGRSHARYGSLEGSRQGKVLSPQVKREAVAAMIEKVKLSEHHACRLVGLSRSVLHYETKSNSDNEALSARLVELARERRRFAYCRPHTLVKREGIHANHKRVHRLYREAGLVVRRRCRRRHGVMVEREQLALPSAPNEVWSMDFVMDALSTGRRLNCLTIVDDFTKESINIVVDHGISALYVACVLNQAARFRGSPEAVRTDQGLEFTRRVLDKWAYAKGVTLKPIQAGKPTQTAYRNRSMASLETSVSMSTGSLRWRMSVPLLERGDMITIEGSPRGKRRPPPHSALDYLPPAHIAAGHRATSAAPVVQRLI